MKWRKKEAGGKDRGREKKSRKKEEKERRGLLRKKQKERPETYVMKKNTLMKTLRIILWLILIFIFFKGVISCLRKDSAQQASQMIQDFREEFAHYKDDNEEIMGFAQNFAREYLTYEKRGENDYTARIRPYVSDDMYSRAAELTDFQGKATAVYVKAYRKENYSAGQYDVYVLADVEYELEETTEREEDGEKEKRIIIKNRNVTLKIPVYAENGNYVVEGIPILVNDSMKMAGYSVPAYSGTALTDGRLARITEAVTSFLTAYYEQDQNVIEYYLAQKADRTKFYGLSGRYLFDRMERISCYETENGILCLADFRVTDAENGNHLLQSFNLSVTADGDRYYIQDLNTKTGHL